MFPLNGMSGGGPMQAMNAQLQGPRPAAGPMPGQPAPMPQQAPMQGGAQSRAAMLLAEALKAIAQEGMSPAVETALESFFLMLQKLHQSSSPAPSGQQVSDQMGFADAPGASAQSAPQPGGRY